MIQNSISPGITNRYLALDVLRGMTIAFMIIVNTAGDWSNLFAPLAHAKWHGFTPTDLVFPTFLFVVGNAMSFSMKKLQQMNTSDFFKKVGKRTVLIFLIGWLLNAFPFYDVSDTGAYSFIDLTEVRLFGVLQRIALCYFFAAIVLYYGGIKLGWIFSAIALLGYWVIMYFFGDAADPYSLTGNAAIKLDLALIGPERMYGGEGIPFDPEGILSTLPGIVNVIAGYLAGKMIQKLGNTMETVKKLLLIGLVLIVVSYIWDMAFPINKKIWTSSYVLLTTGIGLFLLALLIGVIEIKNWKGWTYFFEVFGRNPLILYVLSGLVISILSMIPLGESSLRGFIYSNFYTSWLTPKMASFLFAFSYMLVIWLIGLVMDKRKIYIKV
ncbi:heparan-alpha-glucosaminide N-acetyltransferase domain-containing protein [Algoriphagus sp. D3-2-R+10]|uniref:acyltransferase family protein n=1 Tax=Algoriphagus aurantiacus TaxID=3103948 RepID=UPI002B366911|nr:heparan-alpha-glucosaminide N-acetyltransferase domain-containing protein [Algoriphagus sp. D3-2-R+10]MEB2775530.1 heparan-alpha-glucosaminide N-acetyltransferase domain-containing protein [Algoriphagus sp. D3-2-R+10]